MTAQATPSLDGVRLAVIASRLQGIVKTMMNTLFRTGRSGVLNTGHDFSCCIITGDHRFLTGAESLPIHMMSGPDLMARYVAECYPVLRRGDAFFHNDPYHGNSHAADHCILIPVIDGEGVHHFTVLAKAHQADCGNSVPTTYVGTAKDVYEEGALIFSAMKVQEEYRDREDVIRMCKLRIRVPEQWWGDYLALLGAARIGERRLLELGEELGWETLQEYTREWFDYSERRMIAAIRKLPSGQTTAVSVHDPFPGVPEGIPIKVKVEVKSEEAMIEVDLRENPDCQPCGLNLTEATARTAAMIGVFNSIEHSVPKNAGSFRRLRIQMRENCVVGYPRHPFSCSVATTNVADRVANPVQRAIAELGEGIGMAEAGSVIPPSAAVISGQDPRFDGAPFVNQLILGLNGGAGGPHSDGWLTLAHVGNAGMIRRDSIEVDEIHHPIRIHVNRLIADSEGAGRQRGAAGAHVEYEPVDCTLQAMFTSDGSINAALGARAGLSGAPARQFKRELNGELTSLDPCGGVQIIPGERIVSMSGGGGGYGRPTDRDPELVRRDVVEGWVTQSRARDVYGVALRGDMVIDKKATSVLRTQMAARETRGTARTVDGRPRQRQSAR